MSTQGLDQITLEHMDGDGRIRKRAKAPHVTFIDKYPLRNDPTVPFDLEVPNPDLRTWYEKEDG